MPKDPAAVKLGSDICECGDIFAAHVHSGVDGGHAFKARTFELVNKPRIMVNRRVSPKLPPHEETGWCAVIGCHPICKSDADAELEKAHMETLQGTTNGK